MNRDFGFDAADVDVMILSHAHIDHSGLIPRLVQFGFRGRIFCTPATKDLTTVLLEDSAEIQEGEIKYSNKRRKAEGLPLLQPLYTIEDARRAADRFDVQHYGKWFTAIEGVEVMFTDAGHIIGSACVHLRVTDEI